MSHIRFESPVGVVLLSGAERAYMGGIVRDCFMRQIDPFIWDRPEISILGNPTTALRIALDERRSMYGATVKHSMPAELVAILDRRGDAFEDAMRSALRLTPENWMFSAPVTPGGLIGKISAFALALNTAHRMGSDPVKLMVRLHGQCELHGFVPPRSLTFIAKIIGEGLATGVLRPYQGWEDVRALLLVSRGHAVVTSYSVCDDFPHFTSVEKWNADVALLGPSLALAKEDWRTCYTVHDLTVGTIFGRWESPFAERGPYSDQRRRWNPTTRRSEEWST